MRFLVHWLVDAAALYLTARLVPGIRVEGVWTLLLAALVIGLINAVVKPVLVVLTFPITLLTLGIFYLVLNALLFGLAAAVTPGFGLSGFGAAFLGAIVLSVVGMILHAVVPGS